MLLPIILFLVCLFFFGKLMDGYVGDFRPQGVHSWAQSDRFSIARNYFDNGFNFLQPQTNYLEFSQGKTGVEFPAVQYLAALIAKALNSRDQLFLIYRILTFFIFCIGLQFLSLTIGMHGGNGPQKLLIPLLFLLSPVLIFYSFNFLPDISALSFILISYYYFEKFRLNQTYKSLYTAFAWGFAAALLKLTSAIFPVAYLLWFLLKTIFIDRRLDRSQGIKCFLIFGLSAVICFAINYYFSIRGNAIYKSEVFLSHARLISEWGNFREIGQSLTCWSGEYFLKSQYIFLLAGFLFSIHPLYRQKEVLLFKAILLMGFIAFLLLMGKQLIDHDYYAICTLIPICFFMCLDGIMMLTRGCLGIIILFFVIQSGAGKSLAQSQQRQNEVYALPCQDILAHRAYMLEGADWLKKNNISEQAKIFVLYDYPLNTPLVYFDRKGMVINNKKMESKPFVHFWVNRHHPDYLFIPTAHSSKLATDQPEIAANVQLVYKGKDLHIFTLSH